VTFAQILAALKAALASGFSEYTVADALTSTPAGFPHLFLIPLDMAPIPDDPGGRGPWQFQWSLEVGIFEASTAEALEQKARAESIRVSKALVALAEPIVWVEQVTFGEQIEADSGRHKSALIDFHTVGVL